LDYVGLATTCNNLAGVYIMKGQLKDAEDLYKEAIEIEEKKYGSNYIGLA